MNLGKLILIGGIATMLGCSDPIDGLDESTLDSVGDLLVIKTNYGYGWSKKDSDDLDPIANFHLRLMYLWADSGKLRGGVGKIEEAGHEADGQWVIFSTRHVGHYNFTTKLSQYNLSIGREVPVKNDNGWPLVSTAKLYSGWGEISVNK